MPELIDFDNLYAFTFQSEQLGPIRVWPAETAHVVSALHKRFPLHKNTTAQDFIRFFLSIAATRESPVNPRHRGEALSLEQLGALSDDELNKIAEQVLEHHKYLLEDPTRVSYEQSDSEDLIEVGLEPVNLHRSAEETDVEYLTRVVDNYCEKQQEAMRKAAEQISQGLSKVSWPDLSALTNLNSHIAKSINGLRDSSLLAVSYVPDPQHETNSLLDELVDIVSRQNEVSERTVLAIGQLEQLGQSWQQSALESSKAAARQVRFTNILAVVMTILTILALVLTYLNYKAAILPR